MKNILIKIIALIVILKALFFLFIGMYAIYTLCKIFQAEQRLLILKNLSLILFIAEIIIPIGLIIAGIALCYLKDWAKPVLNYIIITDLLIPFIKHCSLFDTTIAKGGGWFIFYHHSFHWYDYFFIAINICILVILNL